jgi:hypothetical protein
MLLYTIPLCVLILTTVHTTTFVSSRALRNAGTARWGGFQQRAVVRLYDGATKHPADAAAAVRWGTPRYSVYLILLVQKYKY